MKKYTHAWLAMMAMKRIEKADIPEKHRYDAQALTKWFKDHRDAVIAGAWYPDHVICDMGTSHIIKYTSDENSTDKSFRVMPHTLKVYNACKDDERAKKAFTIKSGNLCDRCESLTERIIDSFKALYNEGKGCPICPSGNEIAFVFFMLSHYIADCHMPLHCDARSFNDSSDVHAWIEEQWDKQVWDSYKIDDANERFFYDEEGYPALNDEVSELISKVEEDAVSREFYWAWRDGAKEAYSCGNTWDYMSGISQYSYVMSHKLIPDDLAEKPEDIKVKVFKSSSAYKEHFDEYSFMILSDAVESIAKVWLHAWCRYRDWWRGRELAMLKEEAKAAQKEHEEGKASLKALEEVIATLKADYEARKDTMKKKERAAADKEITDKEAEYDKMEKHTDNLRKYSQTAKLKAEEKEEEIKKYDLKS